SNEPQAALHAGSLHVPRQRSMAKQLASSRQAWCSVVHSSVAQRVHGSLCSSVGVKGRKGIAWTPSRTAASPGAVSSKPTMSRHPVIATSKIAKQISSDCILLSSTNILQHIQGVVLSQTLACPNFAFAS